MSTPPRRSAEADNRVQGLLVEREALVDHVRRTENTLREKRSQDIEIAQLRRRLAHHDAEWAKAASEKDSLARELRHALDASLHIQRQREPSSVSRNEFQALQAERDLLKLNAISFAEEAIAAKRIISELETSHTALTDSLEKKASAAQLTAEELQGELRQSRVEVQGYQREVEELNERLALATVENEALQRDVDSYQEELDREASAHNKSKEEGYTVALQLHRVQQEHSACASLPFQALHDKSDEVEETLALRVAELTLSVSAMREEADNFRIQAKNAEEALLNTSSRLDASLDSTFEATLQRDGMAREILELKQSLTEEKAAGRRCAEELRDCQAQQAAVQHQLDQLESERARDAQEYLRLRPALEGKDRDMAALMQELCTAKEELVTAKKDASSLAEELQRTQGELETTRREKGQEDVELVSVHTSLEKTAHNFRALAMENKKLLEEKSAAVKERLSLQHRIQALETEVKELTLSQVDSTTALEMARRKAAEASALAKAAQEESNKLLVHHKDEARERAAFEMAKMEIELETAELKERLVALEDRDRSTMEQALVSDGMHAQEKIRMAELHRVDMARVQAELQASLEEVDEVRQHAAAREAALRANNDALRLQLKEGARALKTSEEESELRVTLAATTQRLLEEKQSRISFEELLKSQATQIQLVEGQAAQVLDELDDLQEAYGELELDRDRLQGLLLQTQTDAKEKEECEMLKNALEEASAKSEREQGIRERVE